MLAQSKKKCPIKVSPRPFKMSYSKVLQYTCVPTSLYSNDLPQSCWGLLENLPKNSPTMFNLVFHKKIKLPNRFLYFLISTNGEESSTKSFTTIGILTSLQPMNLNFLQNLYSIIMP